MKNTLKENERFAKEVVTPILEIVDNNIDEFDIKKLKGTLEEMNSHANKVGALPFPETLDKEENMRASNSIFNIMIQLIEARQNQKEVAIKQSRNTAGQQFLRQMGF